MDLSTAEIEELFADELVLSKLDVGRRQLNCGIRMFFHEEDAVSMHTVVCAAQSVLRDLAKHEGIMVSVKDSSLVSKEARHKFVNAVNFPQNFFKHANTDPHSRATFRFRVGWLFILDAIVIFHALGQALSHEMRVFLVWVQLRYPGILCIERAEKYLVGIRAATQDPASFMVLARTLLRAGEPDAT